MSSTNSNASRGSSSPKPAPRSSRSTATTTTAATTSSLPKASTKASKSKIRPRLNPRELSSKINQFLAPTLFPRGPDRLPVPPSLAYSRLPPPCAELDEAPKYRIRRFKLWRAQVPELRLAVLDPKRRGQLVRYQAHALPGSESIWQRGIKRKIFPRGPEITDYAKWPSLDSIRTTRRSHKATSTAPVVGGTPAAPTPVKTGPQRRQERIRLKQHRWVLHAENERRWRKGMQEIMAEVVHFQDGCMLESSKWKAGKGVWLPDYDLDEVKRLTNLFRDIRRQPSKVFEISPTIEPVKGRKEAEAAMKKNEAERKARKDDRRKQRDQKASSATSTAVAPPLPSPLAPVPVITTAPETATRKSRKASPTAMAAPAVTGDSTPHSPSRSPAPTRTTSRQRGLRLIAEPSTAASGDHSTPAVASRPSKTRKPSASSSPISPPSPQPQPISKVDQDSLFRLLLQMSKLQADLERSRDDTPRRRPSKERHSARTRRSEAGEGYHESVNGEVKPRDVDRDTSADTDSRSLVGSIAIPSLASSASNSGTIRTPRPGSLNIDDDTPAIDDDTVLTTPTNSAGTFPSSWSSGRKRYDGELDIDVIGRYLQSLGMRDTSSGDGLEIYLSDDAGGDETGSAFDTLRSY